WSDREVMVTLHGERVQGRHVLFRTGERQWMIHRMDPPQDPGFEPLPAGWTPMHARRGELPDDVAGWSFEIAWPGARVLAAVDGHPLTARPYRERRDALETLALAGPAWQTPAAHAGAGEALLDAARAQGLRGIVAKRLDSTYEPGTTSDAWVEVRT